MHTFLFFFPGPFTVSVPYKKRFYPQMLLLSFFFFLLTLFPQSLCEKFIKTHQNKWPPTSLTWQQVSTFKSILQSPHRLNTKKNRSTVAGVWPLVLSTREYPVTVSIIHALLHTFRHSSQSHSSSIKLHLITPSLLALIISTITSFKRQKIPFHCGSNMSFCSH